jgi:hypothetical protein
LERRACLPLNRKVSALELLFYEGQEALGIGSVNDAVIEAERKKSHVSYSNVIVTFSSGQDPGAFFDDAHAEDGDLRLIDNGSAK